MYIKSVSLHMRQSSSHFMTSCIAVPQTSKIAREDIYQQNRAFSIKASLKRFVCALRMLRSNALPRIVHV